MSTCLTLASGRTVELHHDLEGGVDCRAIEYPTGRDVSGEIINDGAPDGSIWLGLDRRSFLAVACVRQAEILRIREDADSLQTHLQRAATSATATSTAAEAIRIIDDFRRDRVGSAQAPTKPLVATTRLLHKAESDFELAEQAQRGFLAIQEEVERHDLAVSAAERRLRLLEAKIADHDAYELEARLAKATDLAKLFPSGEPRDLVDDATIAELVATALRDWDQRPQETAPSEESIEEIEQRLKALPQAGEGDLEDDDGVRTKANEYQLAARILDHHQTRRPSESQVLDTAGLDPQTLRNLARDMEIAARSRSPAPASNTNFPLLAGIAALGVGIAIFLAGVAVPGAVVALAGGSLAAYTLLASRGAATGVAPEPDPSYLRRLTAAGQAIEPDALRALADAYEAGLRDKDAIESWSAGEEKLVRRLEETGRSLIDSLESRIVAQSGETPDATYERYRDQCRQRKQRAALLHQLEILRLRQAAASELRKAGVLAGVDPDDDLSVLAQKLRGWQERRRQRLGELDAARTKWIEYQKTLSGFSLEALGVEASRRRHAADASLAPFGSVEIEAVVIKDDNDRQLTELREEGTQARESLAQLKQRLYDHSERTPDVVAAAEEVELARADLEHLRDLDRILGRTREFLEEAADRAHLNIAPVLQATLQRWLPLITGGRYVDGLVDPQNLEVKVRSETGNWRVADQLSHGTSEQVYLLLRVALAEHLAKPDEPCPIILDDVTAQSDAERTAATLAALAAISSERQVIFFSQEAEVLEWARQNEDKCRLIELPILELAR